GGHYDPDYLVRTITSEGVTVLQAVPTLLERLAESEGFGGCVSLRRVYCGGEALRPRLVEKFKARLPGAELCNLYGPTEATIDATFRVCEPGLAATPIGRPVSNARAYVLDAGMRLLPAGVAGELYLGGECLARGYLNRAGLTAERFVPDPFSGEAGARLYRTGDVARWDAAGELEYLGRVDGQVKVRGYRIELGEVEAALLSHEGVRDAAVAAREGARGEMMLVAYVVAAEGAAEGGGAINAGELREHVRRVLPEYMTPSAFVQLDSLPLTPSGKVDRNALPAPDGAALDAARAYVAPRTPTEELLAGVWEHVLGRERVGRDDDFFLLGGHSLLAMQVIARIRDSFRVDLPVRVIFDSPTLAELSTRVETAMRSGAGLTAPPLLRRTEGEQSPLSYAQQRLWFLDQLQPGGNAYNLPAEMNLGDEVDANALAQALGEVVRRHEALRTTFALAGEEPVQLIHPPAPVEITLVDLSALGESERQAATQRLRDEHALRPFDLSAGPLLRAALVRLGGGRGHLFLLCLHHVVSDGWSMGVLLSETRRLYAEFRRGLPSPLPELQVQYADYAAWQRQWLRGEALAAELDHWKRALDGAPTLLELETDHPRKPSRAAGGAQAPVVFTEELSRSLREFGRREGATLFMTLMAGFHALLHRYTGQDDVLVGTPVAGRARVELEPLVGFFVNMLPVR
ncbi:MAG TPA: condensation domain-containing protein, partial [Pyrinomonadaceae bacterium]